LPDNSVDVVISNCVINLSADKDRVLREAFRVLKPGGRFAVSDVVVRGEVPDAGAQSMLLWVGCIAGALEEKDYAAKLTRRDLPGLRSKSWDEFAVPGAPNMDFVFTVCDNAAHEACPYWPGQPMTAHWGIPDPAAVKGTPEEIARAFRDAFVILDRRIGLFLALPLGTLQQLAIQKEIEDIGRS
jgi:SAM-dependent methyltransferase